jgi:hypothetical protein
VDEREYWSSLEFRVCRELDGMRRKHRGTLWCDGFAPGAYFLSDPIPRIEGITWIGYDANTDEWRFTLYLTRPVATRDDIEWDSLLPAENVTCWLAIDEPGRRLQIEPSAAVPDLA